ncbi:MAG: hypothetical protein JEY96_14935 [Bacteroidales bacterium]|nr:hypothetical protein [Bacteroidales bacterium]
MLGKSHILVANLSLACLSQKERHLLYPRWGGIESGATLSDEYKIMWELESLDSKLKQLVHRCWIDSKDSKNHGCITRAINHAEGSISFINDYLNGDLEGAYNEVEFLENLGMFIGITSHHIADLCTPVHVGHKIDFKALGYSSLSKFHGKVERDIFRCQNQSLIKLFKPKIVKLSSKYFWSIAKETHKNFFLDLPSLYNKKDTDLIIDMSSQILSNAVMHTSNVWHTILHNTKMLEKKWSMQPLI